MIIIAHKERCEYLLDNGITIGADALSGGCYTDTGDKNTSKMPQTYKWNEDPFIWFKYPLYSYCRANMVWSENNIKKIDGLDLWIPKDEKEYLIFITPKIYSECSHKQKSLSAGNKIIIDTILKPMYLIKLPDKNRRNFAEIKKSIETTLKECNKVEFPQKEEVIKSLEYIIKNFDYLKKRHFPTKKNNYDENIHKGRVYLTVCNPQDSYLNKDCTEYKSEESEMISLFSKRQSAPIKCTLEEVEEVDDKEIIQEVKKILKQKKPVKLSDYQKKIVRLKIAQEVKGILESNYQQNFVRFDDVFDNQSVNDFKEMRENAKLTNKINFDLQTKNTPNRLV